MDVVLKAINYNPECFSEIIDDFEDFAISATPDWYSKQVDKFKKSVKDQENLDFFYIDYIKKPMERGFLVEAVDAEDYVEELLDNLPDHIYIYYNTVIDMLWSANWQRYTTALKDTGKASLR